MKKVIALVMCVAMIACVAVTAAAEEVAVTLTVSTVENAKKGDVVTVDLTIAEQGTRIGCIGFLFDYDTDYLKFVMNEDEGMYFVTGEAAGGATAAGNEETMAVQMATATGFYKVGKVLTLAFEVIEDIPEGEIAAVNCTVDPDVTVKPNEGEKTYDITVINGGVKGPAAEVVVPPVGGGTNGGTTVVPTTPTVTVTDTDHDPMGDASAVAVAAGLCAVMAAAFVFTKKAR